MVKLNISEFVMKTLLGLPDGASITSISRIPGTKDDFTPSEYIFQVAVDGADISDIHIPQVANPDQASEG